jgi:hypothetical protein
MGDPLIQKVLTGEDCERFASSLLAQDCRCDHSKLYKISVEVYERAEPTKLQIAVEDLARVPAGWQAEFNTRVLCVLRTIAELTTVATTRAYAEPIAPKYDRCEDQGKLTILGSCPKCGAHGVALRSKS